MSHADYSNENMRMKVFFNPCGICRRTGNSIKVAGRHSGGPHSTTAGEDQR